MSSKPRAREALKGAKVYYPTQPVPTVIAGVRIEEQKNVPTLGYVLLRAKRITMEKAARIIRCDRVYFIQALHCRIIVDEYSETGYSIVYLSERRLQKLAQLIGYDGPPKYLRLPVHIGLQRYHKWQEQKALENQSNEKQ